MKGEGLLMLLSKGKPGKQDEPEPGADDSYDEDLGDAFDEFAEAVKSGDREAGIEAFKAMHLLCAKE